MIGMKFCDSLDQWWHQDRSAMKHVSATTTNSTNGGAQDNCEDTRQVVSQDVHVEQISQSKPSSTLMKN